MDHDWQEAASLSTYIRVLRRRAWIILLCAAVAAAVAYYQSARQINQYSSTAQVFINKQNLASALTGIDTGAFYVDETRAADTQASLAYVPDVAARALRIARIHDRSPIDLLGQASVSPLSDTDILEFTVTDPSPSTAQLLATAYARAFTQYRTNLDTQSVARAHHDVSAEMQRLVDQGKQDSALYTSLAEKQQQLQTIQTLQTSRAYVIRTASPGAKVSPHPVRNAMLGLILGLVLGFGLAFGVEALDTRVRDTTEVGERLGGLPLLARIPSPSRLQRRSDSLSMVVDPKGVAAESYRMLRTNLDFVALTAGQARIVLITSAVEREGKSTTAANLGLAAARAGKRVALLDFDLRRPYLEKFFRLEGAPGITSVALGEAQLSEALRRIDLDSGEASLETLGNGNGHSATGLELGVLDVLPCGPLPPNAGEFVSSAFTAELLDEIRRAYDLVILDSPPALRVGDAIALSRRVDGLIVISRISDVRRPTLKELRRVLDSVPTPKLGYVVTGSSADGSRYGYGYGQGSYYGSSSTRNGSARDAATAERPVAR